MRSSGSRSACTRAMSSSSFAPLAEAVPKVFRPFGSPPPAEAATEPTPAPAPGPPAVMAFLRGSQTALRASLADVKDLELVEDPSLPADGCVIESRFGEVDIGVETQLERALVREERAAMSPLDDLALRRRSERG